MTIRTWDKMPLAIVIITMWSAVSAKGDFVEYDSLIAGSGFEARTTTPYSFDGANQQNFDFGAISGDATFEFIVHGDPGLTGNSGFLASNGFNNSLRYEQWQNSGNVGFSSKGSPGSPSYNGNFVGAESPTNDTHLAFRWEELTSKMTLFVNGVNGGSLFDPNSFAMPTGNGRLGNNIPGTEGMFGTISRVTTFNSALHANEITSHANAWLQGLPLPQPELKFLGDFEHGPIDFNLSTQPANSPWYQHGNAPQVVTFPEPVRHGNYAMKSVLNRLGSPVSNRTEVISRIDDPDKKPQMGEEYWYGFSTYFPEDWEEDNIWEIFAQWHGVPDAGEASRNPPLSLSSNGSGLRITGIWDADAITPGPEEVLPGETRYDGRVTYWEGDVHVGEWTDWVVHVKWSHLNDGLTEIWENGQLVASRQGPNTFNDQEAPFFKMGVYKGWKDRENPPGIVDERIVYHDEVRFAGEDGSFLLVSPPDIGDDPLAQWQRSFGLNGEGDLDGDGDTDGGDFLAWQRQIGLEDFLTQWQNYFGINGNNDLDGDDDTDGGDFLVWQRQFGGPSAIEASSLSVPEPSTFALGICLATSCSLLLRENRKVLDE